MDKRKAILLVLLFAVSIITAMGQSIVSGRVVDSNKHPLEFGVVSLVQLPDSSLVSHAVSDASGNFQLKVPKQGKYILNISFLGFQSYIKSLDFHSNRIENLGQIILQEQAHELSAIAIVGKRSAISQQTDRMIVDVGGSVLTEGNSVLELLERTPGIGVEGEGNFSIQGRNGAQIMIDGRATYLSGSQLSMMLRGMQAHEVSKVELMSSPSARQNAEGSGGIINIVTKSTRMSGLTGDVFVRGSHTRKPQYSVGGGINYKFGKGNVFFSGSHGYDESKSSEYSERRFLKDGELLSLTRQWEDSRTNPGRNYSIRTGFDYALDTTSAIGASFHWLNGRYQTFTDSRLQFFSPDDVELRRSITNNNFDEGYNNLTFNVHYTKRFAGDGHVLKINADYAPHGNDYDNGFRSHYQNASGIEQGVPSARHNVQDLSNTTYVGSVDYIRPLGEQSKLEIGWRGTYLWIDNDVRNDTLVNNNWVQDNGASNRFRYGQHVEALYAIYGTKFGNLSLQAGLRGEYTRTEIDQVTLDSKVTNHYFDLFPNLYLNYALTEKHGIRLTYSRRIERPDDHDVNPFRVYNDPYNYSEGNPYLEASKTHAFEFGHAFNSRLFTTLSYNRGTDIITSISRIGEEIGQTMTRGENVGSFTNYGISLMYAAPITSWWEGSHYANVFQNHYKGNFDGTELDNNRTSWSINSRHTLAMIYGLKAEVLGYFRSGTAAGIHRTASGYGLDLGLSKALLNERGMLKLSCTGIVRNARPEVHSNYGEWEMFSYRKPDNRKVILSFSYRFGQN